MLNFISRRRFLELISASGALLTLPRLSNAAEKVPMKTHTYKTVDGLEIKADVHGAGDKPKPGVIWIHGGALIMGDRGGIGKFGNMLLEAGYMVISIDYRLAPETKLPAILEDVQDAWKWVREKGPGLFNVDPERLAVSGGSAGGYLTLTTGYRVEPKPKALVSFWGYGNLVSDWYAKPDAFYRRQPLVPKEEALKAVGTMPIAGSSGKNNRGRFYLYCRQQGLWPKEVASLDPVKDAKAFDPYCPLRNVTAKYPPTLLIHGTKDTDVPYEESADMDKELTRKGVEHELLTIKDAGHGLSGAKPEEIASAHERALAFVKKHLG